MKTKIMAVLTAVMASFSWHAYAQTYDTNNEVVETFVGSGFSGDLNGIGQMTMFNNPNTIVSDSHSNLFFWDSGNYKIKEITPDGTVTTFAGGGTDSSFPATGTNANFSGVSITSLTIDSSNTLWASSYSSALLWKITSGGVVAYTNLSNFIGTGNDIYGVCADTLGSIYLSTGYGNKIYRYATNGNVSIFAGSGNSGYADGNGIFTDFNVPFALAADAANNIYVWDSGNRLIRKVDQNQNVTTLAGKYLNYLNADGMGTNAAFTSISQMCVDGSGNVILACGSCIRKLDASSNVVTMAGSFTETGYTNGAGNLARFTGTSNNGSDGVCISDGVIFVADTGNQRIRQITFNPQPQVVSSANLGIGTFAGITVTGIVGRTYEIQSSSDMLAWTTRATVLLTSSPYLWIDQNPIAGNKFYQAILLP